MIARTFLFYLLLYGLKLCMIQNSYIKLIEVCF